MVEETSAIDPFLAQWELDSIPACDEGVTLLKAFAERSPERYRQAAAVNFIDPAQPALKRDPLWQAFTSHWASCRKCAES